MSSLSTTAYFNLVSRFIQAMDPTVSSDALDPEEGVVEFTAGNLVVRFFPHNINKEETIEPDALVLEADVMLLDLENRELNHDRFLILHQLNALSQLTTGIIAFITEEGMLSIGKVLPLTSLDEEKLANEVGSVIESGNNLFEGWNNLTDLTNTTDDETVNNKTPDDATEPTEESNTTTDLNSFSQIC